MSEKGNALPAGATAPAQGLIQGMSGLLIAAAQATDGAAIPGAIGGRSVIIGAGETVYTGVTPSPEPASQAAPGSEPGVAGPPGATSQLDVAGPSAATSQPAVPAGPDVALNVGLLGRMMGGKLDVLRPAGAPGSGDTASGSPSAAIDGTLDPELHFEMPPVYDTRSPMQSSAAGAGLSISFVREPDEPSETDAATGPPIDVGWSNQVDLSGELSPPAPPPPPGGPAGISGLGYAETGKREITVTDAGAAGGGDVTDEEQGTA